MQKLKVMIILIVICIFVTVIAIFVVNTKQEKDNPQNIVSNQDVSISLPETQKVTNPHMYFTVKSCAEKYLTYLYQADKDSLLKIIDSTYKKQFHVNEENLMNYVEAISSPVMLFIENMYVTEEDENNHTYYIQGEIAKETINGIEGQKQEFCVTVKLDMENMIYSIIPFGFGGPFYEEK